MDDKKQTQIFTQFIVSFIYSDTEILVMLGLHLIMNHESQAVFMYIYF